MARSGSTIFLNLNDPIGSVIPEETDWKFRVVAFVEVKLDRTVVFAIQVHMIVFEQKEHEFDPVLNFVFGDTQEQIDWDRVG